MRPVSFFAAALLASSSLFAQVHQDEAVHKVEGGGISVPGWTGKADAGELTDSKFSADGSSLRITTGPAATYWNPAMTAKGDYTVKATFTEPKYMSLNTHPHPYGIMIAGNDLAARGNSQKTS